MEFFTSAKEIECAHRPLINSIKQDTFQDRARVIFQSLDDVLGRTLGAYGSPTVISNYPYTHITKDGYSIAKQIEFDFQSADELDRVIASMATDICSRLNYTVGDGTTSSIIAVNQIYKAAMANFQGSNIRPKDLLEAFKAMKDQISQKINQKTTMITSDNLEEVIHDIVNISSNGNEEITKLITDTYVEIGAPAINVGVSDTSETYCEITNGYHMHGSLTDKIYMNNDKGTSAHRNVDVLIFGCKVTETMYQKLLKPLSYVCKSFGRHLLVMAPWYDEVTISTIIRRELNDEYNRTGDINLILTNYPNRLDMDKIAIGDLAMLLNTAIIDKSLWSEIEERLDKLQVSNPMTVVDVLHRGIAGITVLNADQTETVIADGTDDIYKLDPTMTGAVDENRSLLRVGFADSMDFGMKEATFEVSHYNQPLYEKHLLEAKTNLDDILAKFAVLGNYTREVYEAQARYFALKLKTATIYVGGDSELSRTMLSDSVEDAIRAAESAYRNGYIQGCNLTTTLSIGELKDGLDPTSLQYRVLTVLENGFVEVYHRVLSNAFVEKIKLPSDINTSREGRAFEALRVYLGDGWNTVNGEEVTICDEDFVFDEYADGEVIDVINTIIKISLRIKSVFDLSQNKFNSKVINSARTDIEILTACIDLLSLLLVGNQVVMVGFNRNPNNK